MLRIRGKPLSGVSADASHPPKCGGCSAGLERSLESRDFFDYSLGHFRGSAHCGCVHVPQVETRPKCDAKGAPETREEEVQESSIIRVKLLEG